MKAQTKKSITTRRRVASTKTKRDPRPKNSPHKSIENTDLNIDEAERTNAYREEDWDTKNSEPSNTPDNNNVEDTSIEEEQDREALRKMEDAHPDDIMK